MRISDWSSDVCSSDLLFCFVDHFEPMHGKVGLERQRAREDRWCRDYRAMAGRHRDADGRPPQHGFFYPEEEYLEEHLAKIESLCRDGYGEIEVHLHHDRSEEHTSELQSLMRISYAVFYLKKKN